jgi:hypothetical protein
MRIHIVEFEVIDIKKITNSHFYIDIKLRHLHYDP